MAVRLGDVAPDFTAETTEGRINFHEFIGNNWVVLFSHPKDFTPVCTTELGYMARIKPDFEKRGVKIIGLSVDPVDSHQKWSQDIKETQGHAPNYPIIADPDRKIANMYDMIHPNALDTLTVRSVFVIGPDKKVKLMLVSREHGPQLRRDPARGRLAAAHREAQRRDAGELEAR